MLQNITPYISFPNKYIAQLQWKMDSKLTQYLNSEMSEIIAHWLKKPGMGHKLSCLLTLESEACLSVYSTLVCQYNSKVQCLVWFEKMKKIFKINRDQSFIGVLMV